MKNSKFALLSGLMLLVLPLCLTCSLNMSGNNDKGAISETSVKKATTGFSISGRNLIDANGNQFILRGIAHAHVWYESQITNALSGIKSVGANCVRIVLGCGVQWGPNTAADVSNVIALCKANRLIGILEVHDTTGYGDASAACSLATAVTYWQSIKSVLDGQEKYIIINIGNEPYGNNNVANWVADTENAIKSMRSAGFQHTLMVDAPNWGQDYSFMMLTNATAVFNSDVNKNTILSVHMYEVYQTITPITNYITQFMALNLPLVIGEFGCSNNGQYVDAADVMATAQSQGIGYMAWSWCGNSSPVLDMVVNWDASQLTSWGNMAINGANGIKATAKECTVFSGVSSSSVSSISSAVSSSRSSVASSVAVSSSLSSIASSVAVSSSQASSIASSASSSVQYQNITLPFSFDGAGELYWQTSGTITSMNSWNLDALDVNGTSFKNVYVAGSSLPAKQNGYYYIHYKGSYSYSHVEIAGTSGSVSSSSIAVSSSPASSVASSIAASSSRAASSIAASSSRSSIASSVAVSSSLAASSVASSAASSTASSTSGGYAVNYTVNNDWGAGATVTVTIKNNSATALSSWSLVWTFAGNQQITQIWSATQTTSGATVTANSLTYNGAIGANGGTQSFGFNLNYSGSNAKPTSFTLNGTACTLY